MYSDSYKDWLQAWELIQNAIPGNITTFDSFDSLFDLNNNLCFINDMLYDLDEELHNEGLDNLNLLAKRVEISRWVYTQFKDEDELNLGNFRNFEADPLWKIGNIEEAAIALSKIRPPMLS